MNLLATLPLVLLAVDATSPVTDNTGGIVTGGGLVALAAVAWPVVREILAHLKQRSEKRDEINEKIRQDTAAVEREKRQEDVAARVETAKMFREMIEAIVTSGNRMEGLEDQVRSVYLAVIGTTPKPFAPLSPPPTPPHQTGVSGTNTKV